MVGTCVDRLATGGRYSATSEPAEDHGPPGTGALNMNDGCGARASSRSPGLALTVTGRLLVAAGRSGWPGRLEADLLADEDDVDPAGQFGVDLVALSAASSGSVVKRPGVAVVLT